MNFLEWMTVLGTLLLILALASAYLRWLPVTTSVIYLGFGLLISQMGVGLWQVDFFAVTPWLEHLTEVAVLVSLFFSGLKLRLRFRDPAWVGAALLTGPVMLVSITGVCLCCRYLFGLDWGVSLLIGALLAPTDPVLASLVQVNHARDCDRVRYGLTGEAGLNDGMAFPFVVLALLVIEHDRLTADWLGQWTLHRLLWAIPAGLLLGFFLGRVVGRLAIYLRARHADTAMSPNDFLALALIALSYAGAEMIGAWGFLSTFAAGVGLRRAEVDSSGRSPVPAEELTLHSVPRASGEASPIDGQRIAEPKIAAGVLIGDILTFGNLLERSLEVLLVTLLGVLLPAHWDSRALWLGLALFCVIRPLGVRLLMPASVVSAEQRRLIGWFGIRGIGSLYYLAYALTHGLHDPATTEVVGLTLSVVALSILVHGLSTQPLLERYERRNGPSLPECAKPRE
ncbi:cation:proton antiporter [Pseudomonas indica]|uniref:cation:proton antiporter n=1 Tax=Pseudomonas indica TaxID=137658 RepID=UPI000BAB2A6C|nr:cation:proton antiporter [Pseudomonas indica]PAU56483.1 sodium:proton antiporter [Pseudomonas indica]